jgi:threonylcarbamoyladenosine tRNA methylthiotransferase MtaB
LLYTLSCKLNFSETSTIARSIEDEGFDRVDFDEVADVCDKYLLSNGKCHKQFKQIVKKAMKLNDKALSLLWVVMRN